MTDQKKKVLRHIGNELKLLWCQMDMWQELFEIEKGKRQKLIEATAPGFFSILQVTLAESILMRIFRLMDKKEGKRVKGNENISFSLLLSLEGPEKNYKLPDEPNYSLLVSEINTLLGEWEGEPEAQNKYASLKKIRNKWLAHNDRGHREKNTSQSLGIPLTHEEFALAQKLAGRLWETYGRAHLVLLGADTIEPKYSTMEGRPVMLLRRLSHGLYWERKLGPASDEEPSHHTPAMHAFEQEMLGEDCIRDVFIKSPV